MTCCLHFGWYSHFTLFLDVSCSSGSLPLLCAPTDSLKVEVCSSIQLFMLHLILTNIREDADGYTWLKTMKEIIWPGPACRTKSFLKCTSWSLDQLCISLWSASNLRPKRNPKPLTFSSKMLHQQAKKKILLSSLSSTPLWRDSLLLDLLGFPPPHHNPWLLKWTPSLN